MTPREAERVLGELVTAANARIRQLSSSGRFDPIAIWGKTADEDAITATGQLLETLALLGDAVGELGLATLSASIASFAAGVRKTYRGGRNPGSVEPTYDRWRRIERVVGEARALLRSGQNPAAIETRPFVHLRADRIPLNRGGYDSRGRYFGGDAPLYRVTTTREILRVEAPWLWSRSTHWAFGKLFDRYGREVDDPGLHTAEVDTHVRAASAAEARDLVAVELGMLAARVRGARR